MTKPLEIAIVDGARFGRPGAHEVQIIKSRAKNCACSFYAPGWRQMGFATVEQARGKIARHPGFMGFKTA